MTTIGLTLIVAIVSILLFFYLLHHKDEAMCSKEQPDEVIVHGYWILDGVRFKCNAIVGEANPKSMMLRFASREEIIGNHGAIYIYHYEEI
jgi:hypothetical protein